MRRLAWSGTGTAVPVMVKRPLAVERPVQFKPNRFAQITRQVLEVDMQRRDDEFDPARRRVVFEAGF